MKKFDVFPPPFLFVSLIDSLSSKLQYANANAGIEAKYNSVSLTQRGTSIANYFSYSTNNPFSLFLPRKREENALINK